MLHFFNIRRMERLCILAGLISVLIFPLQPAEANPARLRQLLQQPGLSAPHTGAEIISLKQARRFCHTTPPQP